MVENHITNVNYGKRRNDNEKGSREDTEAAKVFNIFMTFYGRIKGSHSYLPA